VTLKKRSFINLPLLPISAVIIRIHLLAITTASSNRPYTTMDTDSTDVAEICFCGYTNNLLLCSRCKGVKYCSTICQRYDWKSHKTLCNPPAAATPNTSATESIRALYFPQDAREPRFIQLPIITDSSAGGTSSPQRFQFEIIFPHDSNSTLQTLELDHNLVSGRAINIPVTGPGGTLLDLAHHLLVVFNPQARLNEQYKPNLCVESLCGTTASPAYPWFGPVLLVFKPYRADPREQDGTPGIFVCQDVYTRDLRTAIDFFRTYGAQEGDLIARLNYLRQNFNFRGLSVPASESVEPTGSPQRVVVDPYSKHPGYLAFRNPILPPGHAQIPGVGAKNPSSILYCRGDIAILQSPTFKESDLYPIEVTQDSTSWPISPISALISLPLRVCKISPKAQQLRTPNWSAVNQAATFLFLNTNTGRAPREWECPGSIMIIRDDGKQLYKEHTTAMCVFGQDYIGPLLEEWKENGKSEAIGSRVVDAALTRKGFEEWFSRFRIQKAREALASGEELRWEKWISPYDV